VTAYQKSLFRAGQSDPAWVNDEPEEIQMRMIVLSALFALGVGLAGAPAASAATLGGGINNAANASSAIELAQYGYHRRRHCRNVRVCHRGPYGHRRCHIERICRW
jgi:hypothetical protein